MNYLFIFFCSYNLLAQTNLVVYEATQVNNDAFEANLTLDLKKTFNEANQKVKELQIELVFNDSISVFKLSDTNQPLTLEEELATVKAGIAVNRFINLKQNKSYYNNKGNPMLDENEFLIYDRLDFNWKIENEEKSIANFKAIKAVGTANKGGSKVSVLAWFAPELPYRHGPFGIGNLPGLILEMQIGTTHYAAKEIILNYANGKIEMPTKGKLIYVEDYYVLLQDRLEDLKKAYK